MSSFRSSKGFVKILEILEISVEISGHMHDQTSLRYDGQITSMNTMYALLRYITLLGQED